jgi:hypothetical protein
VKRSSRSTLLRTFGAPAVIALATLAGLVAALVGDGPYDITSWLGLAVPLAAIAWAMLRRRS